jgi:hypothetical protein
VAPRQLAHLDLRLSFVYPLSVLTASYLYEPGTETDNTSSDSEEAASTEPSPDCQSESVQ